MSEPQAGKDKDKPFKRERRLLSNAEVYMFLKEHKDEELRSTMQKDPAFQDLLTLKYEVLKYLRGTPAASTTSESISAFLARVEPYGLTKAELLTLVNLKPQTEVELYLIIEELEARLTEEQRNQLLQEISAL